MEARNRFISSKAELARVRLQVDMTLKMETYYRTGASVRCPVKSDGRVVQLVVYQLLNSSCTSCTTRTPFLYGPMI